MKLLSLISNLQSMQGKGKPCYHQTTLRWIQNTKYYTKWSEVFKKSLSKRKKSKTKTKVSQKNKIPNAIHGQGLDIGWLKNNSYMTILWQLGKFEGWRVDVIVKLSLVFIVWDDIEACSYPQEVHTMYLRGSVTLSAIFFKCLAKISTARW